PAALAFATMNAQMNDCPLLAAKIVDFTKDELEQRFTLILGAEILYDRPTFPLLARFIACHLSSGGRAVIADAKRTNTSNFYRELAGVGLRWEGEEVTEREERLPLTVGIVNIHW